jgi:hypothetical protein
VICVGELRYLWDLGIRQRQPCGCGEPLLGCPFWNPVLERLGWLPPRGEAVAAEIAGLQREVLRVRHTPGLLRAGRPASPALSRYVELLGDLYTAIDTLVPSSLIVDTSKYPADASVVRRVPGLTVGYVHLVRDPRAVAFSWRRDKARVDRTRQLAMPQYGPLFSTANWVVFNLAATALARGKQASRLSELRYEDFVARPMVEVRDILAAADVHPIDLSAIAGDEVRLGVNHTVNGNPDRVRTGVVRIREDDHWRAAMRRGDRVVTSALAAPWLSRYGYPLIA